LQDCARARRAKSRNADGFHSSKDVARIRAAQRDRCACCCVELHAKGHVDHIIPLSRGGSNWPRNLQLLCKTCNMQKSASDPIVFMQRKGKLL
jgi:5-methylcytosine-specific restriction endonuclease McrA